MLHGDRNGAAVRELAERVFYPLWDAGFEVGHGVRTIRECLRLASSRLDAAASMMDARLLGGDPKPSSSLRERVLAGPRSDPRRFAERLREDARDRHARHGSVSHLLEPDVKDGSGGLRDVHSLLWLALALGDDGLRGLETRGLLGRSEREAVEEAEEYLIRMRSALHLETRKKTDRIPLDLQPALAEVMGFGDEPGLPAADGLMRATFEHARAVEHVRDSVFDRFLEPGESPPATGSEGGVTHEAVSAAFARAAGEGRTLLPALLDQLGETKLGDLGRWTSAVRESFIGILRAGERGVRALEAMDRAGLLATLIPEWRAVRCRPQRDPYHQYTVDTHLLETLAALARLLEGVGSADPMAAEAVALVSDRDGLLLGGLLHDIGKTGRGGHVAEGARVARAVLERMALPDDTRDLALFLIENHLALSDTATRRDLEDEDLVVDVAARVGGEERLAALYLLTVADAEATGPHAWTSWRAALVRELVAKVQHVLERGQVGRETAVRLRQRADAIEKLLEGQDRGAVEGFLSRMPRAYLLGIPPEQAARHFHLIAPPVGAVEARTNVEPGSRPGMYTLTVVARDRPGLLSRIAGALALSGLSILAAQVFTTEDDVAVDVFQVEGVFETEVGEDRWRWFRTTLRKSLEGRLSLEYRVREKRRHYPRPRARIPVRVTVDNDASDFYTVIEVSAADRIGLLFDITRTLTELDLDVHLAKVATMGERVVDAFYVRDVLGRKIEDEEHCREIERAIAARLGQ